MRKNLKMEYKSKIKVAQYSFLEKILFHLLNITKYKVNTMNLQQIVENLGKNIIITPLK